MKQPSTLYRYNLHHLSSSTLEKYKLKSGDIVTVEVRPDKTAIYRVRKPGLDFYGFSTLKEAKAEYIEVTQNEVYKLNEILSKLTR